MKENTNITTADELLEEIVNLVDRCKIPLGEIIGCMEIVKIARINQIYSSLLKSE